MYAIPKINYLSIFRILPGLNMVMIQAGEQENKYIFLYF